MLMLIMAFLSGPGDGTRYIALHYGVADFSIFEVLIASRLETCMASNLSQLIIDTLLDISSTSESLIC